MISLSRCHGIIMGAIPLLLVGAFRLSGGSTLLADMSA